MPNFTPDTQHWVVDTLFLKRVVEAGDALGITDPTLRVKDVLSETTLAEMAAAPVAEATELFARPNVSRAEIEAALADGPSHHHRDRRGDGCGSEGSTGSEVTLRAAQSASATAFRYLLRGPDVVWQPLWACWQQ
jgi:hypothetical protein